MVTEAVTGIFRQDDNSKWSQRMASKIDSKLFGAGNGEFNIRLERYLRDYKRGTPSFEREVPKQLSAQDQFANSKLAEQSSKNSQLYNAYYSSFTYTQRARYVSNVAYSLANMPKTDVKA